MNANLSAWLEFAEELMPTKPPHRFPDSVNVDLSRTTADEFVLQTNVAQGWVDYTGQVRALIKARLQDVRRRLELRGAKMRLELRDEMPGLGKQVVADMVRTDDVVMQLTDEEATLVKAEHQAEALAKQMDRHLRILSRHVELRRQEIVLAVGGR